MPKVKSELSSSKMINTRANSFPNNSISLGGVKTSPRTQPSSSNSSIDALLQGIGAEPLFASVQDTTTQESSDSQNSSEVFNPLFDGLGQNQNPDLLLPIDGQPLAPNPISILNELYQSFKNTKPPIYDYINENYGFLCELEVFGKVYKSSIPRARKQEAKEDAALVAVNDIKGQEGISDILSSDLLEAYEKRIESGRNESTFISKSQLWYRKQQNECPDKKPRVILLEFCQMHRLPPPKYIGGADAKGCLSYRCEIGDRTFRPEPGTFYKANDGKDHVASKSFDILYNEYCASERLQENRILELCGLRHSDASPATVDSLSVLSNLESTSTNDEPIIDISNNSIVVPRPTNNIDTISLVLPSLDEDMPRIKEEPLTTSMTSRLLTGTEQTPPPQSSLPSSLSSPPSNNNFHPYHPSIYTQRSTQNMVQVKKSISLLHELCQSRRWNLPMFNLQNCVVGFIGIVIVNNRTFKGNAHVKKSEAKEDVAGVAYKYFMQHRG